MSLLTYFHVMFEISINGSLTIRQYTSLRITTLRMSNPNCWPGRRKGRSLTCCQIRSHGRCDISEYPRLQCLICYGSLCFTVRYMSVHLYSQATYSTFTISYQLTSSHYLIWQIPETHHRLSRIFPRNRPTTDSPDPGQLLISLQSALSNDDNWGLQWTSLVPLCCH